MSSDNLVILEVNGVPYTEGFKDVRVVNTLASPTGTFEFTTIAVLGKQPFPLGAGQVCRVFVNGIPVINGFIETFITSYDNGTHNMRVGGRDKTADVIDSSSPENLTFETGLSFKAVIQQSLAKSSIPGIKVFNRVASLLPFDLGEIISSQVGEPLYAYLEKYARLRQVFLTTDGLGNITIEQASQTDTGVAIINTQAARNLSNVLRSSAHFSHTSRYSRYVVKSQANLSAIQSGETSESADESVDRTGEVTDVDIRPSRQLTIVAEKSTDTENAGKRALWEKNIRILDSLVYQCQVLGFSPNKGSVWRPNTLVTVDDEFAQVKDKLLIHTVEFSQTIQGGSTTQLKLVNKDALTLKSAIEKEAVKKGDSAYGF